VRTHEEFERFLESELKPRLRAIEDERRAVQARRDAISVAPVWKLAGVVAGLAFLALVRDLWALALCAAPFAVELWKKARVPDTASPMVRSQLLEPLIRFWDESFQYLQHGAIERGEFEASRLFAGEPFNSYGGEDLVTGMHGETAFRFSELRVKHVTRHKNRSETKVVFEGLFFIADFNKSFRGETLVLPDTAERALGGLGRAFQSLASGVAGLALVELENPDFERAFVVRSSDATEARYLLSPSLMQRILAFHQNTGSRLRIAFSRGRIHVALPLASDMFALTPGRPVGLTELRAWAGELLFATSIVDELDLNTRIWSKAPAA
jgi:hypothetical protein